MRLSNVYGPEGFSCCRKHNVCPSRLFHVCHMCFVRASFQLWREQSTSFGAASCQVFSGKYQSTVSTLPTKGGRAFTPPSLEVVLYGSVSAPCQVERLVPKKNWDFFSQCCQVVVHKGLCDCWTMYYCRLISNTKHFLLVPLSNFDSPTCWWTSQLPPVYLHAKLCTEQTPANPKKWIIKWIPPVCGLASNETWIKWFQQTGG